MSKESRNPYESKEALAREHEARDEHDDFAWPDIDFPETSPGTGQSPGSTNKSVA